MITKKKNMKLHKQKIHGGKRKMNKQIDKHKNK